MKKKSLYSGAGSAGDNNGAGAAGDNSGGGAAGDNSGAGAAGIELINCRIGSQSQ